MSVICYEMYEDDIFSPDQEEIFKDDFAWLQAINLTAFTTGNLVFMCPYGGVLDTWLTHGTPY